MPKKSRAKKIHEPTPQLSPASYNNATARHLQWLGVIGFTGIIIFLWGWAFVNQVSFFKWEKSPEGQLVANTKKGWDEAFAEQKEQPNLDQAKEEIKNVLGQMVLAATTSSTTSTTKQ